MNAAAIFALLKKILPMNKIGAFIMGLIGAALAIFLGTQSADLKAAYCAADAVSLPAVEAPATPAAEAVKK